MSIFIILRLVQCICFALYVLWNKWSTVMVDLLFYLPILGTFTLQENVTDILFTAGGIYETFK